MRSTRLYRLLFTGPTCPSPIIIGNPQYAGNKSIGCNNCRLDSHERRLNERRIDGESMRILARISVHLTMDFSYAPRARQGPAEVKRDFHW